MKKGEIKDITGQKWNKLTALKFVRYDEKLKRYIWLYKCDCGNEIECVNTSVSVGNRKSCGCQKREKSIEFLKGKKKPNFASCKNLIFRKYKGWAKDRELTFQLNLEDFITIIEQDCFYCGESPNRMQKVPWNKDEYFVNGIDRIDSTIGYVIENVVPCCWPCNKMKNDSTKEDFFNKIKQIHDKHKKEN